MTVRELLSRTDSSELSEWMAYDRVRPWPVEWEILATLCSIVEGALVGRKGRTPAEFLPERFGPEPEPQTPEQMRAAWGASMVVLA